jgi:hypothetical protein
MSCLSVWKFQIAHGRTDLEFPYDCQSVSRAGLPGVRGGG